MIDTRKPRRMGLTRRMKGLPSVSDQEAALMDDGAEVVFTWSEIDQATPSFMEGDVVVAVSPSVFAGRNWAFDTDTLGIEAEKKKTGPKPKLAKATPDQWAAIKWCFINTKPKEGNAIAMAALFGIETNRDAIRYRINEEIKAEMLKADKEGGE